MSKALGGCAALLALAFSWADASAEAPEIGTTIAVRNQVMVESEASERRRLLKGGKVHQEEVVETAKAALAEIRLLDDTKLAVGPGARVVLDKFVYDPNAKPGAIAINLTKGAFRFISGSSPSTAYEIRTPTASMGVRGTVFDVYVAPNGETAVLLHEGAVDVCAATAAACRRHDVIGRFVHVGLRGLVSLPLPWDGTFMRGVTIAAAFPFVGRRLAIDPLRRLRHADLIAPATRATRAVTKPVESLTKVPRQIRRALPVRPPF
ncbi:MAG: FecR domain-containing protein [Hyphomicrobiaceae bacterium]|nr:FecR domain-containing protein [Hyphomicrobiaceae bacterium]